MAVPLKKSFYQEFTDLVERHKFVDWAFVGRTVDSNMDSFWDAGTGKDVVADRERIDVLSAEMDRLRLSMLLRTTPAKKV